MLVGDGTDGFQFNDKLVFDEQVGEKFANQSAIFVVNVQRVLLDHREALLPQAVNKGVFVDFLCVAVTVVTMNSKTRFADHVA
jgi:hypothetical protein